MTATLAPQQSRYADAVLPESTHDVVPETTALQTEAEIQSDLDAQSPAADLVRVYLNGIGKTALLTAADEVELCLLYTSDAADE